MKDPKPIGEILNDILPPEDGEKKPSKKREAARKVKRSDISKRVTIATKSDKAGVSFEYRMRTPLGVPGSVVSGSRASLMPVWGRRYIKGLDAPEKIEYIDTDYLPSPEAAKFHAAEDRFRLLLWGVKSGKTEAGGREFLRFVLGIPGSLSWVVAPTYGNTEEAEYMVIETLRNECPDLIKSYRIDQKKLEMKNGSRFQFKTADRPNNLRGPNISGVMWFDEAGFLKTPAWFVARSRISATGAEAIFTTTPDEKNWLVELCYKAGMPQAVKGEEDYGVFQKDGIWVSHFPTWHFPWVQKEEIEDVKKTVPRLVFEKEYGAKMVSRLQQVFSHVGESIAYEMLEQRPGSFNCIGVDLAKHHDFTAIVVLDGYGNLLWCDKWNKIDWTIQNVRIVELAKKWNSAIILDRANVGSVIEETLRAEGVNVYPVDMNSANVKSELIQSLQISFERGNIHIPHPKVDNAPETVGDLIQQLQGYEFKLTPKGRIGYDAPAGTHDDFVVALALANWGRLRGLAQMSAAANSSFLTRKEIKEKQHRTTYSRTGNSGRPGIFRRILGKNKSGIF